MRKIKFNVVFFMAISTIPFANGHAQVTTLVDAGSAHAPYVMPQPEFAQNFVPQNYQGLVIERYQQTSRFIGNMRVSGTPYLFGSPVKSIVYAVNGTGYDVMTAYDTYLQKLEIFQEQAGPGKIMTRNSKEIDSFLLINAKDSNRGASIFFINSRHLGERKSFFLQIVYSGKEFTLYKAYRSELDNASTDYLKADEKIFALKIDYYYSHPEAEGIKKFRPTKNALKNEFGSAPGIIPVIDAENLETNTENALIKIFTKLNDK